MAVIAAFVPLTEIAKLVNIGTLFAFLIVNIGVIVLRRTAPDMERSFRVPLVPWFPLIGSALCIYLMTKLEGVTWLRFFGWLVVGLVIYFAYGRTHSRLQRGEEPPPAHRGRSRGGVAAASTELSMEFELRRTPCTLKSDGRPVPAKAGRARPHGGHARPERSGPAQGRGGAGRGGRARLRDLRARVTKATASHHFKVLREAGITLTRIDGAHRLLTLRRDDLDARFPGLLDAVLTAEPAGATA